LGQFLTAEIQLLPAVLDPRKPLTWRSIWRRLGLERRQADI
jgi:hypothetical protein